MSFTENLAKIVADQIARFVTLNRHQLAGHVANLDFWVDQVRHALEAIDGYEARFRRLKSAQDGFVSVHNTRTYFPDDPEIQAAPDPPRRVPHANLREARRSVSEATYRFLVRCCNEGLIPESQLRALCTGLSIGVEATDLRRKDA
jgi:hypothetical protein